MQPGTRIGDYEMIQPLGSGGMAQVWLARNPHMNRPFAVKFILPQLAANREIQTRFRDEAWRQSGLHHPNIVQIHTVLTEGAQNYIVMEYVESGLDRHLHALAGRPLPVPESIDIALQVLDALEYTHTLPEGALIHRDIKPSNILIKADGGVRLTDFGIALATKEARKTLTGQVLGTSLYMSPEQIVSPSRVGCQTDIYSFACVLYEMLTGRPPFGTEADTDFSIHTDHVNRMPDPLRKSNASVPERFEWIVLKALAKDPAFRFQSCREMASALLVAYREEGLPMEMLRSYRGGLTSTWQQPHPPAGQPQYSPTVVQQRQTPLPDTWPANFSQASTLPPNSPPGLPLTFGGPMTGQQTTVPQMAARPVIGKSWYAKPLFLIAVLLLLVIGGSGIWWFMRSEVILRLEGSTSVGDKLAPALAAEYLAKELHADDVKTKVISSKASDGTSFQTFEVSGRVGGSKKVIRIVSNGSGKAFTALANTSADLGMSSRPYSDSDPSDLSYLPASNNNEHVVALDGIAVIVNSANRVQGLSLAQLKGIFTGAVTSWNEVNGNGGRIHCYGRESASGTFEMFRNKVVGKSGSLSAIDASDQFTDGKALVERIASDPDGIGYVTFTQATGVRVVAVSDQGTTAMYPNALTVSTEDYVLTRRLYLYQPRDVSKTATDFITFVQGQEGQSVVSSNGFVSLMPKVHDEPVLADSPGDYRGAVSGLGRLGVSFRFTSGNGSLQGNGGYALDSLAQDNILRLKTYMEEHTNDEITLLGFTDNLHSSRTPDSMLAKERAQSVADELMRSGIAARVYGLGDEMPVASNTTADGRAKNRRVEVWVRTGRAL
jgi:phosphate transport system substrate-binding protein